MALNDSTVCSPQRLWQALESVPGLATVPEEWRRLLGTDYACADRFLRSTGKIATTYPVEGGEARDVVPWREDRFIAVRADGAPPLQLQREQLVIHALDVAALSASLCTALGFQPEAVTLTEVEALYRVASWRPTGLTGCPVFFSAAPDTDILRQSLRFLSATSDRPLIVLCSRVPPNASVPISLRSSRVCPMALADCLMIDHANQFVPAPHADYIKAMFADAVHAYEQRESSVDAYQFRRQGRVWVLTFDSVTTLMPDRDAGGLAYVQQAIRNPHTPIHVKSVMEAITGKPSPDSSGVVEPVLNRSAMLDVRRKFDSLQSELDQAREFQDLGRVAALRTEMGELADEINRTRGRGGRQRSFDDDGEKLRKQIGMAVSRAFDAVESEDARLARHLRSFVNTGYSISYTPDSCPPWVT